MLQKALAHALRHRSEIARCGGEADRALSLSLEAVALYRTMADPVVALDLANALRGLALAHEAIHDPASAAASWREARELYHQSGVAAGRDECDAHLGR